MIRLLTNAGAICVNMIFIFKKDLYSLRFITILGTGAVVYNSLVILVTAFIGFKYEKAGETHDVLPIISPDKDYSLLKWANFDNPWLQLVGFASTIFCYVNHQMVFPISQELANPTMRRLHKIFDRAHISEALIYMVVGVMGYLLLFQEKHIDSIVLQSITTTPMLIGKISPNIGKMLMLITLFFAVPLNMLPAR
jgi:amino acid permease